MTLFDEPITMESLLERIEALEAALEVKGARKRTDCPPEIAQAWGEWNLHRAGKGWTAQARKLSLTKLVELSGLNGEVALKIVRQSIERSYTGLFPVKEEPKLTLVPQAMKGVKEAFKPSETPLERDVAYARQLCSMGQIDVSERDRRIAEATAKHRSRA